MPHTPDMPHSSPIVPIAVDRTDVTAYYEALSHALTGDGPALMPYDSNDPAPELPDLDDMNLPEGLALVVSTSGSTGTPKRAMLTRDALRASAVATLDEIGGAGTWLLPLPPHHIAGTQVLVRSIVCGTTPIVMPSWDVAAFTKATGLVSRNAPPFTPIYTSLVPAQLRDVLADPDATQAARRYRAILVGGAATHAALLDRAHDAGLRLRLTYGSSETAGGCVYDGTPLDGVGLRILEPDDNGIGRVALTGPTVASGYLADPERTRAHFVTLSDGTSAYLTDDLGTYTDRLQIFGRVDDVINTGGYKVAPKVVQDVVAQVPGIADSIVVATEHPRYGQAVSVALVLTRQADPDEVRAAVHATTKEKLPHYAVPTRYAIFEKLPLKGIGKPDTAVIAASGQWHNLG